jgi:hypothetical protein
VTEEFASSGGERVREREADGVLRGIIGSAALAVLTFRGVKWCSFGGDILCDCALMVAIIEIE